MHNDTQYLLDIIILLSAAIFIVAIFWKLHISPVLGYFVAGAIIGSHGLNLVQSSVIINNLAEFGVVFLLFLIGLELTFERLMAMRLHVFGFGSLQVIFTSLLIWLIIRSFDIDSKVALIIGGALALSSTAIVLQVVQERGYQSTQVGRLSTAILLLQDFAVVPLIVLLPLLTGESGEHSLVISLLYSLLKAAIALVIIFTIGRLLLRPLFTTIAAIKSHEIFIAATLLIVLGAAFITENFNLSMALGAFVSGLLVAETEYRYDVEQVVLPFKRLLLGLFFMSVGMSIDIKLLLHKLPLIMILSVLLISLKAIIIYVLCRLFQFKKSSAIQAGLLLSQGGEFAFILFGLAAEMNVLPDDKAQILMMLTTVTMAVTPLLAVLGEWISKFSTRDKNISESDDLQELNKDIEDLDQHLIVAGFGRVGKMVAKMLAAGCLSYITIDIHPKVVKDGKSEGFPVYLGDVTKLSTLESIGMGRAKTIIISINNEVTIKKIISLVSQHFPDVTIIVRLPDLMNAETYRKLGAHYLIPETYETGLQLGAMALNSNGLSDNAISSLKNKFRMGDYAMIQEEKSDIDE